LNGLTPGVAGLFMAIAPSKNSLILAVVAALLVEAMRQGARFAYLQVTASNVAALALYRHFGFMTVYDYWYRARAGEQG
jgi:hypothetical protein